MTPPLHSPPSSRDGLALVLALAAVALLSGLSAWLFAQALASHRAAAQAADTARLRSAALQSLHAAMDVLRRDDPTLDTPSDLWALPATASFDGVSTRSLTTDASSLFPWNLFAATNPLPRPPSEICSDWLAASGHLASDALAAAAADFMDPDLLGPYEAPFYARQPRPFSPPNRPLNAPADLLLLPGFRDALSAPPQTSPLYPSDPLAQSAVVPLPPDLAPAVNLNTASPALLLGLFGIDRDDLVHALLALRSAAPISSPDALTALDPSLPAALSPLLAVSSSVFRIRATASLGTTALTLSAWVRRAPDGSVSILQYWEEPGAA